jgi:carbon monoxide dehydrogenase subunit G
MRQSARWKPAPLLIELRRAIRHFVRVPTFQFQGEELFDHPQPKVWRFLTDLRNIQKCSPQLQEVKYPRDGAMTAKLVPEFSFARGALDLTVELKEKAEPDTARVALTARGMGSNAEIEVGLSLTGSDNKTQLRWTADAKLGGLLSAVSKGLVEGAARKVIAETFAKVRNELKN